MRTPELKIISIAAVAIVFAFGSVVAEESFPLDDAVLADVEGKLNKFAAYRQLMEVETPSFEGIDHLDAYLAEVMERYYDNQTMIHAALVVLKSNEQANSAKTDAALVKCLNHYFDKKGDDARQEVLASARHVLKALTRRSAISKIERKREGLFFFPDAYVQEVFLRELINSKKEADQQAIEDFMKLPEESIKVADEVLVELGLKEAPKKEPAKDSDNPLRGFGLDVESY